MIGGKMRSVLIGLVLGSLALQAGGSGGAGGCGSVAVRSAPSEASFTCATCGGTYAQAGNCPKCGLELVPKKDPAPKGNAQQY